MKPKVVYWNNIPTPYVVERFNALARRGHFDLEVWFSQRILPNRSWSIDESKWEFPYQYLPRFGGQSIGMVFPLPLLIGRPPDLLVSLYAEPSFLVGWQIARLRGAKTMFRVLKTFDRWVPRRRWKERLKKYVFSRVDAIETTGADGQAFVARYVTEPEKVFSITHAVNAQYYAGECEKARAKRDVFRKELGVRGLTFLFVGRLWWGKGVFYMLDAFKELQAQHNREICLLLVGDGVDEAKLKEKCSFEGIGNVIFTGFVQRDELPRYFAAADVFLFPTLGDPYGLVVDEAMASSLPIISTDAAGEIRERVENGVNGYIVPPEDAGSLTDAMAKLLDDDELRNRMGAESMRKIGDRTPARWAQEFEKAVSQILSMA